MNNETGTELIAINKDIAGLAEKISEQCFEFAELACELSRFFAHAAKKAKAKEDVAYWKKLSSAWHLIGLVTTSMAYDAYEEGGPLVPWVQDFLRHQKGLQSENSVADWKDIEPAALNATPDNYEDETIPDDFAIPSKGVR